MLELLAKGVSESDEISLSGGDFGLGDIPVDGHEVTSESRELVVPLARAAGFPFDRIDYVVQRNVERGAGANGFVDGGFERWKGIVSEQRHDIARKPVVIAIVFGNLLEAVLSGRIDLERLGHSVRHQERGYHCRSLPATDLRFGVLSRLLKRMG